MLFYIVQVFFESDYSQVLNKKSIENLAIPSRQKKSYPPPFLSLIFKILSKKKQR